MIVVSLVSQKGGAGKTTIAVGLAVAHELAGGYAVLVDLDPQGSASVWSDLRAADRPVAVATHVPRLARVLDAAREGGAQLAVIDTAPHASDAALAAAQASDLILVPCRPSVADLHAIRASLDICRVAQGRARVVLNAVPVQGPLGGQAREAIAGHRATVAPMVLCQRIAHVHAYTRGMTAMEFAPRSKAAAEFAVLYDWAISEREGASYGEERR